MSTSTQPTTETTTSYNCVGITRRDFLSQGGSSGDQFTIKRGRRLLLKESSHAEWWKFTIKPGRGDNGGGSGFIPRECIQEIKSVSAATACKGFVAQADGDATIAEHETLLVYGIERDWALVKNAQTTGYVPKECIRLNDKMGRVVAQFDFNATDAGELSFKKGEILTILERKYEHWWLCKNANDSLGVVPRNHVKPVAGTRAGSAPPSIDGATKSTNSRQSTPISKKMVAREVVSQLVDHGCEDLTDKLDLASFGEYPVNHGGFSDIYRGLLLNGTQVAAKALRVSVDSVSQDPKHLKQAARELHTWGKCRHPNVVPLLGLAIFRDRIGMIAPWMKHGSLPRYLEREPEADRFNMCVQICEGLAYLHRIGIIHCDLKGANVLVSEEGNPALTDFGNSSLVDRTLGFTRTTGGPVFTVRWAAAEILDENPVHTEASDVYALGMTIYETITGKIPYYGKNDRSVFLLVTMKKELPERHQAIPNDGGTADKLWTLLKLCWSFEPIERPGAAEVAETMRVIKSNAETPMPPFTLNSHQNISARSVPDLGGLQWLDSEIQKGNAEKAEQAALPSIPRPQETHMRPAPRLSPSPTALAEILEDDEDGDGDKDVWYMRPKAPEALQKSADEEYHHTHLHPEPPHGRPHPQRTPSFSYRYRPASAEAIAAAEAMAHVRRAEEIRRYQEHQEEIKYRERQAARAAREARDTAPMDPDEVTKGYAEQIAVAGWQRYERGWQDLINGVNPEGRPLTFYDIPWPLPTGARSFEELHSAPIERFLLSPYHSATKTREVRLRAALMQWHPDKFARQFVDRIEESHRPAILTAVNSVARTITELMNKEAAW